MRTLSVLLTILVLFGCSSMCQAGLIDYAEAASDGDGAVTCVGTWNSSLQAMTVLGNQYSSPGHIGSTTLDNTAYFHAQSEDDPTITLRTTMENDTTSAWTGYHVNIYMNKAFTVLLPTVYTPDTSVAGWSVASYVETAVNTGGQWVASVDFAGPTAIGIGGTLDFSYKLQFIGSVAYCQEMIPVPEPCTLALSIGGLLGLLIVRRRFACV